MYPVTQDYQDKIKESNRTFKSIIQIQHSTGVLDLTDKDIIGGSIVFNESSQAGEEFTIGGTVASTFDIKLINKPEYASINFEGATIIPQIGLLLRENIDTENYFLSAPQPTEFQEGDGEEIWEYVSLGRFNIDEAKKLRNTIELRAIDNMIEFDRPYSLSNLSYPATLYQIYVNACNVCDVTIGTTTFPNKDYIVKERPADDLTFRDILGYVAELSGTFARMNRSGASELTWYKDSGLSLGPSNRFNFVPREDLIQIKGIKFETEDTVYLTGTDEYVVDLSDNPLLQDNYDIVLPIIFDNIKDTIFTPFESNWQGNPAIQAGDMITQTDRDGNIFNTIVTNSIYKYRGASSLSGKGLPLKAKGYKGSTNKKIANIVRKEIIPLGDKLTTLEQAQLDATELIANMLGGYAFYEADGFYVADNPILANAKKVWKWGIGGFGYSSTGKNGPFNTAITSDGSIVAMLVAANIITANMVQTGILQSEDGSTWINLDNGEFNFKNAMKYVDGTLTVGDTIASKEDIEDNRVYFEYSVDNVIWKSSFQNGDKYIRQKIGINGTWSTGVLFKGNDGVNGYTPIKGTDYFDGVKGQDGTSNYIWVKYSANADGTNFGDTPNTYLGVATTTTSTAPTLKSAYKWTKIEGTDGTNGVAGEDGSDGQTSYLHIKYSDNGTTFTANNGETLGAWIGTYVDFTQTDSNTFSAYTWNKVKGDDGAKVFNSQPVTPYKLNELWKVTGVPGVDFRICTTARESGSYVASDWTNVTNNKDYVDTIKNLTPGTAIKGGITTIDNTKVRVEHVGLGGQYSDVRADGFVRKWQYGEAKYLNDIHSVQSISTSAFGSYWTYTNVDLPTRFRGREIKVFLTTNGFSATPLYFNGEYLEGIELVVEVVSVDTSSTIPSVMIKAYSKVQHIVGQVRSDMYRRVSFGLIAIGY